jgi:peptidoglycan-associated lipoprotein
MKKVSLRDVALLFAFVVLIGVGCKKKVPPPPPPPPPAPAAARPSVTLSADPATIQRGGTATLRWSSQNATDLNIQPNVGPVDASGSRAVSPADSTTYNIPAKGRGGSADATARLTVTAPPPPPPAPERPAPPKASMREQFDREVKDAFFDFDKADIRQDSRENLTKTAEFLRANPNVNLSLEGHCDEKGSVAYNLGLGDRRANAAKDFLVSLGISADRIKTISYGKERPFCTEHDESCWQQNRRAHAVCDNCGS